MVQLAQRCGSNQTRWVDGEVTSEHVKQGETKQVSIPLCDNRSTSYRVNISGAGGSRDSVGFSEKHRNGVAILREHPAQPGLCAAMTFRRGTLSKFTKKLFLA